MNHHFHFGVQKRLNDRRNIGVTCVTRCKQMQVSRIFVKVLWFSNTERVLR
jgi:hypothetical protein